MRSVNKLPGAAFAAAAVAVFGAAALACSPGPAPTPTLTPTAAPTPTPTPAPPAYEIRTVLDKDAIPAILEPLFLHGEAARAQMSPQELVIGVSIGGDHRAYAAAQLSRHEVVNDTVGGRPVAVTW